MRTPAEEKERVAAYNRFYHLKHREFINEQHRIACTVDPEKARGRTRKSYWKHRAKYLAKTHQYYQNNKIRLQQKSKERRHKRRIAAIERLGGKCVKCGFSDWRALQIDHIHGNGLTMRKGMDGEKVSDIILSLPDDVLAQDFQLLCANCNWIKRIELNETRRYIYD